MTLQKNTLPLLTIILALVVASKIDGNMRVGLILMLSGSILLSTRNFSPDFLISKRSSTVKGFAEFTGVVLVVLGSLTLLYSLFW